MLVILQFVCFFFLIDLKAEREFETNLAFILDFTSPEIKLWTKWNKELSKLFYSLLSSLFHFVRSFISEDVKSKMKAKFVK